MASTASVNHESATDRSEMAGCQNRQSRHEGAIALLSIHPNYVKLIQNGTKRVEFRRRPFAREVSHLVIYSTAPVQRLIGFCEVERVVTESPTILWSEYKRDSGITREVLLRYLSGLETAVAIMIKSRSFVPFSKSPTLPEIGIKHPPQSFQYLDDTSFRLLTKSA